MEVQLGGAAESAQVMRRASRGNAEMGKEDGTFEEVKTDG